MLEKSNFLAERFEERLEGTIEKLWPRVFRFFYYRVQNREEAEELTQETFHRVYRRLEGEGIDADKLEPYLFTAARNQLTDLWRKRGRHPGTLSVQELQGQGWDLAEAPQEVEDRMTIQQALNQLAPDYRQVLTWRIIEGRPVEEVAKKMKRTPGAVRSLQFRAVRALKELLEKGGYFDE